MAHRVHYSSTGSLQHRRDGNSCRKLLEAIPSSISGILKAVRKTADSVYGLYSGGSFFLGVRIVLYTSLSTFFVFAVIAAIIILTLLVSQISPPLETLASLLLGGVNNAIRGSSAVFNPGLVTAACYLAVDGSCVGIVQDDDALRSLGFNT